MNQRVNTFCAMGLLALATSCAGSYAPIRPKRFASYLASPSSGPVSFAYQFDALRLGGPNKKYVKKEMKKGYHVVAVRVTNNWDREINFSRDLTLLYGDRPIAPVPSTIAARDLRQGVAIYLLYLLGNVQVGGTVDPRTGATTGGTFLPTGIFMAGGNMLGAGLANSSLRKEFESYDLTNRTIKPGETVYGIMSLRETAVAPLRVEFRASTPPTAPAAAVPAPDTAPTATPAPATSPR
ncbi:hypothetical protein [Hymenobacter ruber]